MGVAIVRGMVLAGMWQVLACGARTVGHDGADGREVVEGSPAPATTSPPPSPVVEVPTASGDASPALPTTDDDTAGSERAREEMMARWNAAAGTRFHWGEFDRFPHPTYQGGTAEAYRAFASVLLAYLTNEDNFSFLSKHHLFQTPLRYVFPSGQVGINTSLQQLARNFSAPSFADTPAATQGAFADLVKRIDDAG